MPQFLILADDHTDPEAINRRLAVREDHLVRLRAEKSKGVLELAGAKLDATGKMIGSMLIINVDSVEDAWQWVQQELYVKAKVWDKISVTALRVANI